MELFTKEQWNKALEDYSFSCIKIRGRYSKGEYKKTYTYPLPTAIYEIFSKVQSQFQFQLGQQETNCSRETYLTVTVDTLRDKKTGEINPIIKISMVITPEPGKTIKKSENEATILLAAVDNYLGKLENELKGRIFGEEKRSVKFALTTFERDTLDKKTKENKDLIALNETLREINSKIIKLEEEIHIKIIENTLKELKKNKKSLPKDIKKFVTCGITPSTKAYEIEIKNYINDKKEFLNSAKESSTTT